MGAWETCGYARASRAIYNGNRKIMAYFRKLARAGLRGHKSPRGAKWPKRAKLGRVRKGYSVSGQALGSDGTVFYLKGTIRSGKQAAAVNRYRRKYPAVYKARTAAAIYRKSDSAGAKAATQVFEALTREGARGHFEKMSKERIFAEYGTSWDWIRDLQQGYTKRKRVSFTPRAENITATMKVPPRQMLGIGSMGVAAIRKIVEESETKKIQARLDGYIRNNLNRRAS